MTAKSQRFGEVTEEGVKNILAILYKTQKEYGNRETEFFTSPALFLHVPEAVRGYPNLTSTNIDFLLEEIYRRGYLERGIVHWKIGRNEATLTGFRIKQEKLSEIETLLGEAK